MHQNEPKTETLIQLARDLIVHGKGTAEESAQIDALTKQLARRGIKLAAHDPANK